MFAQRCNVLVEVVDVDVDVLLVVDVDVDVDVLVDVDVVLVVVSHPVQVLSHCFLIDSDEHNPAAKRRSHWVNGNEFTLFAHLCSVEVEVVVVELLDR